ncbi:50S ribosomal protein L3 [Nitrosomonas supralitoralis]|uniref:Large ribosomal subunit protein uL3 n=1 Tax=Nitrosomonas supralitoralis TaxID=2116706 RepID=A0A2P7NX51_9PROT|nr:50S ribosomal protein L3 [Nitrosomonas supralitoralis]PSJ18009.1 50S ribosomal protein L3 [Nitrosomonas supralitoralis]
MSLGLIGRKIGMTRIFAENGDTFPVTVIDVSSNRVTQIKQTASNGYCAAQISFGQKKTSRVKKSMAGHCAKAGVVVGSIVREFRVRNDSDLDQLKNGMEIKNDIFKVGQKVDISGVTIGKGFAGAIKLHHFSSNRASHGNSKAHNKPGSIGMAQDPGRIFPGKRMAAHMGNVKRTTQNIEILRIDTERDLLLVKGAIPGSKGGYVIVRSSIKEKK